MKYLKRVCDNELQDKLDVFGAVHITGPKWCGKTTTAKQFAKSFAPDVMVLEPKYLADEVAGDAEKTLKAYINERGKES